ncbi:MAG: hypothetical protein JSW06_03005 [Thermoplasmatales archaeon]|nr:MAG: hypothetical protein JSW06_03005 [Thermoplasmatales archaeon]
MKYDEKIINEIKEEMKDLSEEELESVSEWAKTFMGNGNIISKLVGDVKND